jgi:hypothetical protein
LFRARRLNPNVWLLTATKAIPESVKPRSQLLRWIHRCALDLPTLAIGGAIMNVLQASPRLAGYLPYALCMTNVWVAARSGTYRVPAYEAIHYVNSAAVEHTLCRACEWSIPFRPAAPDDAPDGYERVRRSFATLHDLIAAAFREHPITDPRSGPANFALEMRTMAPSRALLSPQHLPDEEQGAVRFAVPELVTSARQPAWPEFVRRANGAIVEDTARFGEQVRCHLAKEWSDLPYRDHAGGMPAFLRAQYQAAGTWQRFLAVREALDPEGIFLNDFLRTWFEIGAATGDGTTLGRSTSSPASIAPGGCASPGLERE